MNQISPLLSAALLSLALIACTQSDPNNITIDEANNSSATADVDVLPPSENAGTPGNSIVNGIDESEDSGSEDPNLAFIPAQYRGRWGMVPADCTSTRGDAKGLIDVGDTAIKFYEARATLKEQRPAIATSFSGLFGFTGEGQTWEKVMTFTRTGDTLKRADKDGNYSYTRC